GGGRRAEIGGDQQLLELLQRRVVELALGEDAGDAVGDLARRPGEAFAQPGQPAALRGGVRRVAHAALLAVAASAVSPASSAPVTRAATISPGAAAPLSVTGANCALWPRLSGPSAVSTSTATAAPCCAA